MQPFITTKLTLKPSSEDILKAGDACIVEKLGSTDGTTIPHLALVFKCPCCRMDMATTSAHHLIIPKMNALTSLLRFFGFPQGITIQRMLQCPYVPAHRFYIKKGKFVAA